MYGKDFQFHVLADKRSTLSVVRPISLATISSVLIIMVLLYSLS
jgi:hypothetical protein